MANDAPGCGPAVPDADRLRPGQMIRVRKRLRFQDAIHPVIVEGRMVEVRSVATESSFAGAPGGRYRVSELAIEKADGERSVILLDRHTEIEILPDGYSPGAA